MKQCNMNLFSALSLSLSLFSMPFISQAAEKLDLPNFETTQVAPGIYMLSGVGGFTGGNIALSIGDDGVVMIDDSMPPLLDKMKKAIATVTDKPVDFLINTHVHGDHTGNNATIGQDGTRIIAHENMRTNMLLKGMKIDGEKNAFPKSALPVITFSEAMNFHLNGEDARVFHVDNAHTDGDAVIHYKNSNVIHTGDTFFNGIFPYIDLDNGGSINGYINAQKTILAIANDQTKIIPGHGPLANKKDLEQSLEMLEISKALILDLINKNKSEEEVVALNPLKRFHEQYNWSFITTEKMTRQVYKSLKM